MTRAKEIEKLDCAGRAIEAAQLVLSARLEEMCALSVAAINWSDPEGVHDMRVASRRLRSAMGDFKIFFRKRRFDYLRARVKQIADALGRVRDDDVAIIALDALMKESPEDAKQGITFIADERRMRREAGRAELVAIITSSAMSALQTEFTSLLNEPLLMNANDGVGLKFADRSSFRETGSEVITRRLRKLQKSCRSLLRPFEIDELHQTRIEAKRARYALELYEVCWGGELLPAAEQIAEMQSSLGEVHDCDVWIADLGANLRGGLMVKPNIAEAQNATENLRVQKNRAAIWLLSYFSKTRTKHYRLALEQWHEWESENIFTRLREIVNHDPLVAEPQRVAQTGQTQLPAILSKPKTTKQPRSTGKTTSAKKAKAKGTA